MTANNHKFRTLFFQVKPGPASSLSEEQD